MFPANKNSYLHSSTHIDPRIINRSVDLARGFPTFDQFDDLKPFNRLTSSQPCIPVPYLDVTRRPLAFGRWAMPILRRDLHHKKHDVVLQTLNTIIDIVHDPERNIEAINLKIPDRMVDLLEDTDPAVRERVCMALATMCNLLDGKYAVVKNRKMLLNLAKVFCDTNMDVRYKATCLIHEISQVWMAADYLVDGGFIELIINRVNNCTLSDECMYLYLKTLEKLMYCNGKSIALENNLFEILLDLLNKSDDPIIIGAILKDISILTQIEEGLELAIKFKLLKILSEYINDNRMDIYENAACALIFITEHSKAIVKSLKLPKLMDRLLLLANNHHEPVTQRYCLQVLGNLGAHRNYKLDYVTKFRKDIDGINVGVDKQGQRFKKSLFDDVVMH